MLDNLGGSFGCLWRESAERSANRNAYRRPYARSVYSHPAPIIAFNTTEGWSRDMTADITDERADDLPRTMAYRTHWSSYSRWQGAEVWTRTLRTSSRIIKVALFFCGFPTTLLEFRTSHHCCSLSEGRKRFRG